MSAATSATSANGLLIEVVISCFMRKRAYSAAIFQNRDRAAPASGRQPEIAKLDMTREEQVNKSLFCLKQC